MEQATPANHEAAVLEGLYPDAQARRTVCELLGTCIEAAEWAGSNNWGITVYKDKITMNFGGAAGACDMVLHLQADRVVVVMQDDTRLDLAERQSLTDAALEPSKEWKSVQMGARRMYDIHPRHLADVLPIIRKHARDMLVVQARVMSRGMLNKKCRDAHDPALVDYLNQVLGRNMKQPQYARGTTPA